MIMLPCILSLRPLVFMIALGFGCFRMLFMFGFFRRLRGGSAGRLGAWSAFFATLKTGPEYVEYKCLHSEISHIGQALISAKITLENNPEKLGNKSRPDSLTREEKKSRGIHECDQNIPELLVSIKALTAIGGLCLAKSQCERLS